MASCPNQGLIKIVQVNLAQKECLHEAHLSKGSILLVQEPYVGANAHVTSPLRVIQKATNNINKPVKSAAFIIDKRLKITENPEHISENIVAFVVKLGYMQLGIFNVYL